MKNTIRLTAICCILFFACNNNSQEAKEKEKKEKSELEKKVTKRNLFITPENAYSDMFLDSMAMENYLAENQPGDSVVRRMRSFYNARNYQYAWFYSNGLTEQALGFWNLLNYALYTGDTSLNNSALQKKMSALLLEESLSLNESNESIRESEFAMTTYFIRYNLSNFEKGYVKRKEMERFIPINKEDAQYLADSLINKKHKDDKYFEDVHQAFKGLKGILPKYLHIAKSGGWPELEDDAKLYKKGSASPSVAQLKRRLQIEGLLPAQDTGIVFNDTLENAIKTYQRMLGYTQDGVVTKTLLNDLNVPAEKRLQQLLMNLNRMRWMPQEPEGKMILVNIPEFMLHIFEGKNKVMDMVVVVGKEGHNTMMFTGELSQVVFSPYWNVPPSIVKNEILPKMNNNPAYLASQHMEVVGDEGGLPSIRQLPGDHNALGKVKFLFPNSFNIYFHDTPSKSLFSKDKRAFSHGCIRLSEPQKMAEYLLKDKPEWTTDKVYTAMNATEEKYVTLKDPVPVFITYYTAWVDETGLLNFRDDIYDHDKELAQRMFTQKAATLSMVK